MSILIYVSWWTFVRKICKVNSQQWDSWIKSLCILNLARYCQTAFQNGCPNLLSCQQFLREPAYTFARMSVKTCKWFSYYVKPDISLSFWFTFLYEWDWAALPYFHFPHPKQWGKDLEIEILGPKVGVVGKEGWKKKGKDP